MVEKTCIELWEESDLLPPEKAPLARAVFPTHIKGEALKRCADFGHFNWAL